MTASSSADHGPVLDDSTRPPALKPFVKRLKLTNFKSIRYCDVEFGPLTFLIGRNGSGKSNVLDALKFVGDCFGPGGSRGAFDTRGLPGQLLQRLPDGPESFEIGLELNLPSGRHAFYSLICGPVEAAGGSAADLERQSTTALRIQRETLKIHDGETEESPISSHFKVVGDEIVEQSWRKDMSLLQGSRDKAYLEIVGTLDELDEFREIQDALRTLTFYDFDVKEMKDPRALMRLPASAISLDSRGVELAGVLSRLQNNVPKVKERLEGYLNTIVPNFERVEIAPFDGCIYMKFHQGDLKAFKYMENDKVRIHFEIDPATRRNFLAASMSDGTLRALGVLTAAFQAADTTVPVRLVCIEEPEISVHPAATAGLVGGLEEASYAYTQIIATTQSADVLDAIDEKLLGTDVRLLAVEMIDGVSYVGPIDQASLESIEEHLDTPGGLLRTNYIEVDLAVKSPALNINGVDATSESSRTQFVPDPGRTSR